MSAHLSRAYTGWSRTCVAKTIRPCTAGHSAAAVIRESCKAKTMSERLQRFLCSNVHSRVSYKHDVAENFNRHMQALCLLEVCACRLCSRCPVTTLCALMRTQASARKSRPFTRNNCIRIVRYVCKLVCTSPSNAKRVTGAGANAFARAFVLRDLQRPMCCQPSRASVKTYFFLAGCVTPPVQILRAPPCGSRHEVCFSANGIAPPRLQQNPSI
jgi:hypothetical protein